MCNNYNKDPRIINWHKYFNKFKNNKIICKNNKFQAYSIFEINYIVNQTNFKYDKNKLYILNLEDYLYYVKRKKLMCKNGFYCDIHKCGYMHVKPNLICPSNYHKIIKCNKNTCKLIHIELCFNNGYCRRNYCVFLHNKDKK